MAIVFAKIASWLHVQHQLDGLAHCAIKFMTIQLEIWRGISLQSRLLNLFKLKNHYWSMGFAININSLLHSVSPLKFHYKLMNTGLDCMIHNEDQCFECIFEKVCGGTSKTNCDPIKKVGPKKIMVRETNLIKGKQ